jgi:hypothetical protein
MGLEWCGWGVEGMTECGISDDGVVVRLGWRANTFLLHRKNSRQDFMELLTQNGSVVQN